MILTLIRMELKVKENFKIWSFYSSLNSSVHFILNKEILISWLF